MHTCAQDTFSFCRYSETSTTHSESRHIHEDNKDKPGGGGKHP